MLKKVLLYSIFALFSCLPMSAQTDGRFEAIVQVGVFTRPVFLTHAGDERLFVVEQAGRIRLVDETGEVVETPFLDISAVVGSSGFEQGLLGLAFHPEYAENSYFFVNYTNLRGDTVIARYSVSDDPNLADPTSAQVILQIEQPHNNHNGGMIVFGPDGYLYIGMGDGGSGGDPDGNGQNLDTLLGKMLRLDVDSELPYAIPSDNPYADGAEARPEIWAYGLRNPWRFSFDRETGDLWIADVGQGELEEINFQPADSMGGENYGWNYFEGSQAYRGNPPQDGTEFITPIAEYGHNGGECSVTGGYVYRGPTVPALVGQYFYADFCSGDIWTISPDGENALFSSTGWMISSFGEDVHGDLYVLTFNNGLIYKLLSD